MHDAIGEAFTAFRLLEAVHGNFVVGEVVGSALRVSPGHPLICNSGRGLSLVTVEDSVQRWERAVPVVVLRDIPAVGVPHIIVINKSICGLSQVKLNGKSCDVRPRAGACVASELCEASVRSQLLTPRRFLGLLVALDDDGMTAQRSTQLLSSLNHTLRYTILSLSKAIELIPVFGRRRMRKKRRIIEVGLCGFVKG